jgi:hypothetical protein
MTTNNDMNSPELQLSVNDLVYPTEKAEILLETLSNEQLSLIEEAVNKIKAKKLSEGKHHGPLCYISLSYLWFKNRKK